MSPAMFSGSSTSPDKSYSHASDHRACTTLPVAIAGMLPSAAIKHRTRERILCKIIPPLRRRNADVDTVEEEAVGVAFEDVEPAKFTVVSRVRDALMHLCDAEAHLTPEAPPQLQGRAGFAGMECQEHSGPKQPESAQGMPSLHSNSSSPSNFPSVPVYLGSLQSSPSSLGDLATRSNSTGALV
eukprot:CAMPEP_0179180618 /NCGR_PEP_ID=MMETSP0796-20121207/89422_1 /TAXON_ID=73915 /ORGANISM="Pyrodinium bahamense, Strain pbaha01" /LENGTH=183 /DNA_ID=CAMNT_0020884333 /DNA_START=253 /DNA_END=801 /DNA_ORIENTATION=+